MKEPRIRFKEFRDGWQISKIENVAKVESCKRIYKSETSSNKSIPFYKIGNFGGETDTYIDKEKYLENRKKYPYPKQGDILISASGTLGKTIVYNGENAYYQDSNIIWLNINKEKIINPFLLQLYKIINWNVDEGSTIKRLYNRDILNTNIYLPSINEQHKISQFFQKLDQLIKMQSDKLEHLNRDKKGYLQKMFVDGNNNKPKLRFKEFNDDLKNTRLKDICSNKTSNLSFKGVLENTSSINRYPVFDVSKLIGYLENYDQSKDYISIIKDGSNVGESMLRPAYSSVISTMNYILPNNNIDVRFLNYIFKDLNIIKYKVGTGIPHIYFKDYSEIKLSIPSLPEQHRIGQFFSHLDHLIDLQQQKVNHLKQLKQAYLQKMFV